MSPNKRLYLQNFKDAFTWLVPDFKSFQTSIYVFEFLYLRLYLMASLLFLKNKSHAWKTEVSTLVFHWKIIWKIVPQIGTFCIPALPSWKAVCTYASLPCKKKKLTSKWWFEILLMRPKRSTDWQNEKQNKTKHAQGGLPRWEGTQLTSEALPSLTNNDTARLVARGPTWSKKLRLQSNSSTRTSTSRLTRRSKRTLLKRKSSQKRSRFHFHCTVPRE